MSQRQEIEARIHTWLNQCVEESGHRFAVFYLEDAIAENRAMMATLERYQLPACSIG